MFGELKGDLHGCAGCDSVGKIHYRCYQLGKSIPNTESVKLREIAEYDALQVSAQAVLGLAQQVDIH